MADVEATAPEADTEAPAPQPQEREPEKGRGGGCCRRVQWTPRKLCCCTLCVAFWWWFFIWFGLVLLAAFLGKSALADLSKEYGHGNFHPDGREITIRDVRAYEWWPGCHFSTAGAALNCGAECCKCSMFPAYRNFNMASNFTRVSYSSRPGPDGQETVTLTGWWLPAGPPGGPIIVLQHGMGSSMNGARVQLAAYFLRSAGFSVLMSTLRGHGVAGHASHGKQSWGFDYPYDVLGAWDYAVSDPDGLLGGRRSDGQVGLMGFSMGGFATASAFGLERRIPALWADGAVTDPREIVEDNLERYMGRLAPLVVTPAWSITERMVGVSLRSNLPAETLPTGPLLGRQVMVVHSDDDTTIVMDMSKELVEVLSRDGRYKLSVDRSMRGKCGAHDHNVLMWTQPTAYRSKLCAFWSGVFYGTACSATPVTYT